MTIAICAAGLFCLAAVALHLLTIMLTIRRCRPTVRVMTAPPDAPPVTLLRPVCGIENYIEETLRSGFTLDYPRYEMLFCVARADDPIVPLVQRLIAQHPQIPARLLVGDDAISDNPKLNNVLKGWRNAAHAWIVIADSNVLMPRDYVQRLLAAWRPDTGLVCSPPIGSRPDGRWAELECAFLNAYQARFQYGADTIGFGFAQGKTMLWHRAVLDRAGGAAALAAELAEDAAATKIVRSAGLRVRLVDAPFDQPLGRRDAGEVWRRQVRWSRLRRASFKSYYTAEIITGGMLPLVAAGFVASALGAPVTGILVALAALWYGGETLLAVAAGWHVTWRSPLVFALRDALMPVLWVYGWTGNGYVWRGNHIQTATPSRYGEYRIVRSFTRMTSALVRKAADNP